MSEDTRSDGERLATGLLGLAEGMLEKCTQNYVLIWSGANGDFGYSVQGRTWGLGAVERVRLAMVELEKKEARGDGAR